MLRALRITALLTLVGAVAGAETALVTSFAAGFTVPITIGNGWSVLAMGIVGAALAVLRLQWEFRARD